VLAPGQEIEARRNEAYNKIADDQLVSDASSIRFEGMEVIEAGAPNDQSSGADRTVFRESTDGMNDPHLIAAIERALKAVERGGTLEIHVESRGNERTTRIRLDRRA
jgi:hypothetical protein